MTDARAVQVEVYASHFFNQFQQAVGRILLTDVDGPDVDTLRSQLLQFFQILFTPASQSEYPSFWSSCKAVSFPIPEVAPTMRARCIGFLFISWYVFHKGIPAKLELLR